MTPITDTDTTTTTTRRVPRTFFEFLDEPIAHWSRPVIIVLSLTLLASYVLPLWRISMIAPQYPQGLVLDIYAWKLEAGNDGADLAEINILNHYIGMHPIQREDLRDLDWMPFALGILFLLGLRLALIGNVRSLIDLAVLTMYVGGISFTRFVYQLWTYGHDLDPRAPVDMEPFTPVVIGSKQVANFTTYSYPRGGGLAITAFAAGITLITLAHLWKGRRRARHLLGTGSAPVPGIA